jgi:hypothetical protein
MADRYFPVTTAPEYRGITGRNINHRLEIMKPAPTTTPEGTPLRFMDEIRITTGSDYYPVIAEDEELQAEVLQICQMNSSRETPHDHLAAADSASISP